MYFGEKVGLSFIDVSTAEFFTTEVDKDKFMDELKKKSPKEVILPLTLENSKVYKELKKYFFITSTHKASFL